MGLAGCVLVAIELVAHRFRFSAAQLPLEAVGGPAGAEISKSRREFSPTYSPFRYVIVFGI